MKGPELMKRKSLQLRFNVVLYLYCTVRNKLLGFGKIVVNRQTGQSGREHRVVKGTQMVDLSKPGIPIAIPILTRRNNQLQTWRTLAKHQMAATCGHLG